MINKTETETNKKLKELIKALIDLTDAIDSQNMVLITLIETYKEKRMAQEKRKSNN